MAEQKKSKTINIAVETLIRDIGDYPEQSKAELFDRLVQDVLIDHPYGHAVLLDSIDLVCRANQDPDNEELPLSSAIMIAFKTLLFNSFEKKEEKGGQDTECATHME